MTTTPQVVSGVKIKKSELLTLGGADESFSSGCAVIEVVLSRPQDICQISFTNHYTASLDVRAKVNVAGSSPAVKMWKTVIRGYQLMNNPHCEAQSQNNFVLKEDLFRCKLDSVISVRFILRQPSPNWLTNFSIQHIHLHTSNTTTTNMKTSTQNISSSRPSSDDQYANEHVISQVGDLPHPRSVSRDLHKLLLLSHNISSLPPPTGSLGRFHSNHHDSYDVSMLTYN